MSRLVDVNKLKEAIIKEYLRGKKTLMEVIDEQPTAFDVDNVIEQIEYRRANFDCKLCKYNDDGKTVCSEDCSDALIDDLIEIVKSGGIK